MGNATAESDQAESAKHAFKPRGYQLEMLDESLKRNIIVAMPTGSGKTLIAAMRAREALESSPEDKIVWFCAPKVELARQQMKYMTAHLGMFNARLLSGADNCDCWKAPIWDEVLSDTRIIVSTYDILLDALKHAFLEFSRLALLIFDEAHHAVKKHPASQIMQRFYHRVPIEERSPVLGLTATPTTHIEKLGDLESNLNALSRTPDVFAEELQQHVKIPTFVKLAFTHTMDGLSFSKTLRSLDSVFHALDVEEDPWVIRMRSHPETRHSQKLLKAILSGVTYTHEQMGALRRRAKIVAQELGLWAADIYLHQCIRKFLDGEEEASSLLEHLGDDEKAYLKQKLRHVTLPPAQQLTFSPDSDVSPKLQVLIDFLAGEQTLGFTGLVFAQTRAEVAVIAHILSIHPLTSKFAIATFVGNSTYFGRRHGLHELAESKHQRSTLDELRVGRINLIVTTEALEEGIDVISCNLVICFEKPRNIRSFVQRRGRARNPTSRFVLLLEECRDGDLTSAWKVFEDEMSEMFRGQTRHLQEYRDVEEQDDRVLRHDHTGAQITPSDAVGHLYHFCSVLTKDPFVDASPSFEYDSRVLNDNTISISATVRLPNIVDRPLRFFHGFTAWTSEKAARRDAAFEAYKALYDAGLLNDHLLPLEVIDPVIEAALLRVEVRPNVAEVLEQINLWPSVTQAYTKRDAISYASKVRVRDDNGFHSEMVMLVPFMAPHVANFKLYWSSTKELAVTVDPSVPTGWSSREPSAIQCTQVLLSSIFKYQMSGECGDLLVKFVPSTSPEECHSWLDRNTGTIPATDIQYISTFDKLGLVRDMTRNGLPFILRDVKFVTEEDILGISLGVVSPSGSQHTAKWTPHVVTQTLNCQDGRDNGDTPQLVVLEVSKLSKRRDFLHKDTASHQSQGAQWLLAECCHIDRLPYAYSSFALLVPAILHKLHVALVAERLNTTLLSSLGGVASLRLVTAISASSAREEANYQRLEFLGDSILKLSASLMLMTAHLKYHENILTRMKEHIVSNVVLARAAIDVGLAQFIQTKPFTGAKWRPPYATDYPTQNPQATPKRREMSTKILADVVEALIGAAFLDGGYPKATACMKIFLPNEPWHVITTAFDTFHALYSDRYHSEIVVNITERVVQYSFMQKSLLVEAITHASHQGTDAYAPYERLEFLGDAVLDSIVTNESYNHRPELPVKRLHLIRSAVVNGDYLGYLCFVHAIQKPRVEPITADRKNITIVETQEPLHLWQILRYASPTIRVALRTCLGRLEELRPAVAAALEHGDSHPWTLLARLDAPKPFSDIVESIIGAVYLDSRGSIYECEKFLERIGLMGYLKRVMNEDIALLHPKEELGQLSDQEDVQYRMGTMGEEGKKRLTCTVVVGEREVVTVGDGLRPLETQTRAAEVACGVLKRERREREEGGRDKDEEADVGEKESEDNESVEGGIRLDGDEIEVVEGPDAGNEGNERDSDEFMTAEE